MKKAIIIGATSGIGKSLASVFLRNGFQVGLTGRRLDILKKMKNSNSFVSKMDLRNPEDAIMKLRRLIREMKGVDIIIISSAVSYKNTDFSWEKEKETVETNILGFVAMLNEAFRYFSKRKKGHIVGISSIAAFISILA